MTLPFTALPVVLAREMKTRWCSVRWGAARERNRSVGSFFSQEVMSMGADSFRGFETSLNLLVLR